MFYGTKKTERCAELRRRMEDFLKNGGFNERMYRLRKQNKEGKR